MLRSMKSPKTRTAGIWRRLSTVKRLLKSTASMRTKKTLRMKVVVPKVSGKIFESTKGSELMGVVPRPESAVQLIPKVAHSIPMRSIRMRRTGF